jgi:hypothetical protein
MMLRTRLVGGLIGALMVPAIANAPVTAASPGVTTPILLPPATAAATGEWQIPKLGPPGREWAEGRSGLGGVQVLVEPNVGERGPLDKKRTRFAIARIGKNGKPLAGKPRVIQLDGQFGYDAISNAGDRLFVAENRDREAPGTYRVRIVDLRTGELDPRIVSDVPVNSEAFSDGRPTPENLMYGYAVKRVRHPLRTHWIFTLYDANGKYPFVHALNTEGWALCVDLPRHSRKTSDIDAFWDLRATKDTVFVSNSKLNRGWSFPIGTTTLTKMKMR